MEKTFRSLCKISFQRVRKFFCGSSSSWPMEDTYICVPIDILNCKTLSRTGQDPLFAFLESLGGLWKQKENFLSSSRHFLEMFRQLFRVPYNNKNNTRKMSVKCLLILSVEMIFIFDGFADGQINKIS